MKNYLVTGGSKGIGKSLIELLLLDNDKHVINLDISDSELVHMNLVNIRVDITNQNQLYTALDNFKHINYDGLFLNAGMLIKGSIFDISIEDIQKVVNLNVWSNIFIIKHLQNNINNGSSIVFNDSDQCFVAKSNSFAYTMSKGAIAQMTKSLAIDLAKEKIRVNTVCPGTVDTDLYRGLINKYAKSVNKTFSQVNDEEASEFPLGRIANPKEVADLVYFLLSDKSEFMTGSLIPIDGGYTAK